MRVLRRALASTVGSKPLSFLMNVVLPFRAAEWKLDEVVYGAVSYVLNVNPGPEVAIYPGEQLTGWSGCRVGS